MKPTIVPALLCFAMMSAAATQAHAEPPGAAVAQRRAFVTDGQGAMSASRYTAWHGPRGSTALRRVRNTRAADGSVQHQASLYASGARGTVSTRGSMRIDASGQVTQGRQTSAFNAVTGNSVQANTAYSKDTGLTRSVSCFDASGLAIACPTRR